MTRKLVPLPLLLLAGCIEQNLGVESQHKPIVADGRASVPHCPDWRSQGVDSAAGTDSNYGCAINGNLAAMIADPQDLVRGVPAPAGAASDIAPRVIGKWRTGARGSSGGATTGGGVGGGISGDNGLSRGPTQ